MALDIGSVATALRHSGLIGNQALQYGSPDVQILLSGGPASHLAQTTIICGPSKRRIIVRQPDFSDYDRQFTRTESKVNLDYSSKYFSAEIEEWKHGSWYHEVMLTAENLQDLLNKVKHLYPQVSFNQNIPNNAPSNEFWVGAVSYDMVQWTQPIFVENRPKEGKILMAMWQIDKCIINTIETRQNLAIGSDELWIGQVNELLSKPIKQYQLKNQPINNCIEISNIDDSKHTELIKNIQESIAEGDYYQINLGRYWSGTLVEQPFEVFLRLAEENPAPFSVFIEAEDLNLALISSSPENLLRCDSNEIVTSPIKGTTKRGSSLKEDSLLRSNMIEDEKERSEHRMLVDLMRNDLTHVCKPGTIKISKFDVEAYANVQHLVSHICGQLADNKSGIEALNALFPGGSITGCPRTVVCSVIDKIEQHKRSFWTGSAGWIDLHEGKCSWNILIRTIEATRSNDIWNAIIGAGGGITIKSNPELEVHEAKLKSFALRKACGWIEQRASDIKTNKLQITKIPLERNLQSSATGKIYFDVDKIDKNANRKCVLIIDNLDSFTMNIANSVTNFNRNAMIINGRKQDTFGSGKQLEDELKRYLETLSPSHIILGPGPGRPDESEITMKLATMALSGEISIPILGICLGHQALGLVDGYDLIKDPYGAIHGAPVPCLSDGSGLFDGLEDVSTFVRYNSLCLESNAEKCMKVNARDKNGSILGIYHESFPIYGIQFHPESIGSPKGDLILSNFFAA